MPLKTVRSYTLVLGLILVLSVLIIAMRGVALMSDENDKGRWEQAEKDLTRIYEALQAEYEAKKAYPEKLEEMTVRLQGPPPMNPFSGGPYSYKRTVAGFRLVFYGKDEVPGGEKPPNKDIVFTDIGRMDDKPPEPMP